VGHSEKYHRLGTGRHLETNCLRQRKGHPDFAAVAE